MYTVPVLRKMGSATVYQGLSKGPQAKVNQKKGNNKAGAKKKPFNNKGRTKQ